MNENLRALCERHGMGSVENVKETVRLAFGKLFIQKRAPKGMSTDKLVKALIIAKMYLDKDELGDVIDWAYGEEE